MLVNNPDISLNNTTPFLAEAICACLVEQGLAIDQINIHTLGAFKKTYRSDVASYNIDESKHMPSVSLSLHRNGFYDLLPEGLFHQSKGMQAVRSVQDAVHEHKQYKEEERQARKFFAPIEEIILKFRTMAELSERKALYAEESELMTNSLLEFWNIDKNLPRLELSRMLRLMPYLPAIKGGALATEEALAYILNTPVTITNIEKRTINNKQIDSRLDQMILGDNSIIGSNGGEIILGWKITIHQIEPNHITEYVRDQSLGKLLSRFEEIFIPIDRDVFFEFDISNKSTETFNTILGYGCIL